MKWRFLTAIPLALLFLAIVAPGAFADSTDLKLSIAGKLDPSVGINTIWVIVAGALVMFMQAGFAFLEIGFSRGKNAGTVVAKILTNFSIAAIGWWAVWVRVRVRGAARKLHRPRRRVLLHPPRRQQRHRGRSDDLPSQLPGDGAFQRDDRVEVVLPVRLLRRVAGDRLGHDAGADQVRRLHHLRDRLLDDHLPDRRPLGVRWRVPPERALARDLDRRHAGLRRFDRRPPDRRQRRLRGAAAARAPEGQVRARREAAGDPRAQHAAVRARRADPLARLVRVQPGIDAERA